MDKYLGPGWQPSSVNHTVHVQLQWGDYKGEVIVEMGGNTFGANLLSSVTSYLIDGDASFSRNEPLNQKHIIFVEDEFEYSVASVFVLYNADGDSLHIDTEDGDAVLGQIVVGMHITKYEEE